MVELGTFPPERERAVLEALRICAGTLADLCEIGFTLPPCPPGPLPGPPVPPPPEAAEEATAELPTEKPEAPKKKKKKESKHKGKKDKEKIAIDQEEKTPASSSHSKPTEKEEPDHAEEEEDPSSAEALRLRKSQPLHLTEAPSAPLSDASHPRDLLLSTLPVRGSAREELVRKQKEERGERSPRAEGPIRHHDEPSRPRRERRERSRSRRRGTKGRQHRYRAQVHRETFAKRWTQWPRRQG